MRKQKILSALLSLCILFCLVFAPVNIADAANEAVQNARNGILEVRNYVYEDGDLIFGSRGTGFLVGTDSGAQTVITNFHVVQIPTDEKALKSYLDSYGVNYDSKADLETRIEIVVKRDVVITAEIVNYSEAGDFAILKLEQPIYDRSPLTFADSSEVVATQPIYALGFPAAIEANAQADEIYTATDVTVTDGTISKIADANATGAPISTIVHSATISGGNSGGPLVNADGQVVGINTYLVSDTTTSYYYSTEINEVADILRALGIEFVEGQAPTPEPGPEPDPEPVVEDNSDALAKLAAVVEEAEEVEVKDYTEESVEEFEGALKAAKKVSDKATVAEIEAAKGDLEDAMDALEEKAGLPIGLIAGAAAAVVVVIIVVVIVTSKSKKNKASAPQPQARPVAPVQQPKPPVAPARPVAPMPMMNEGSEETGVLNDGSSETTVLGGGASVPPASLIRRKNNERVTVTKQVFKIGKERRKVDYCVADNTNVSRAHADIVFKNGDFYIVDCNAKNGTYVNGVSVAAGQERKLMNNDIIKLADEEFQFRTF